MLKPFLLSLALTLGISQVSIAQDQNQKINADSEPKSTFINITEIGFARGIIHENQDQSFGFQTINGFEFNQKISIGIGVGTEKYKGKNEQMVNVRDLMLLPVFTDVRIYFGKGKVQPYFGQSVGYAFCIDQPVAINYFGEYDEKGGIMLSPSVGFRTNSNSKVNFIMNLGYRYQENTQEMDEVYVRGYYNYGVYDGALSKRFDHYLTLKLGLTF